MKILVNDDKTIVVGKNGEDYILKYQNNFYKLDKNQFSELCDESSLFFQEEIKENSLYAFSSIIVIIVTLFTYFYYEKYVIFDSNFILANVILICNIFIHEFGHIIALKWFYRGGKIKIGFKLHFIYPAVYVDTSDSYFLPKYKRIFVYLAGNLMNCIYILMCFVFFPNLNKYNYIVVSTILINFLPIIKSDGYYAFITLIGRYNNSKSVVKNYIEDTVRGVLMFIFLLILSKIRIIFDC